MIFRWTFIFAALVIAPRAWADEPATRPAGPVTYQHLVWTDPPMHLHIARVDLTDPAVHVKVAHGGMDANLTPPWETTLMPVAQMCQRDGLFLAVNGNFFTPKDQIWIMGRRIPYFPGNWALVSGWAMSDGVLYSPTPVDANWPTLIVSQRGRIAIGRFVRLPAGVGQAVAGDSQIVTDGKNTAPLLREATPAPRTAAGIDRQGTTLILLVVDGRRTQYSAGMSERQLGEEMVRLGAWQAINLDGAGSSTMVMRDAQGQPQVMNRPSDGHDLAVDISVPRSVANALGVIIDRPATRPDQAPRP